MRRRYRKILFSFVSISLLVAACSLFTPDDSVTLPSGQNATPESQATALDVTNESPTSVSPTPTEDTFLMPTGKLLFGGTNQESGEVAFFTLNLADKAVEPYHMVLFGEDSLERFAPVFSPDYSHYVFNRYLYRDGDTFATNTIYLYGPENDLPIQVGNPLQGTAFSDLTWSADSRFLTYWWDKGYTNVDNFTVYEVETASLKVISLPGRDTYSPALSPDGEQIAYMNLDTELNESGSPAHTHDPDSGLYLMDVAGSNAHQLIYGEIKNIMWHPDGSRIFYEKIVTEYDPVHDYYIPVVPNQVFSYDLTSGLETLLTPSILGIDVFLVDVSPDGKFITVNSQGGILLKSTEGGPSVRVPGYDPGIWSPDGRHKICGCGTSEQNNEGIYILDTQGRGQVMVYYNDIQGYGLFAWLP